MYSSYTAVGFALRASKPSLHAHSSYPYSYLPSHHCHRDDADGHHQHHKLLPQSPYLAPRFLLDGCLLRHSAHLLLLSARLRPPPPPHPHPPHCCSRRRATARCCDGGSGRPAHGHVSWRVEARGCPCSGRGAGRPDLGAACRRLEARGCDCGGSGGPPRLVGRAVRQEVWEYDGEWPRRRCSTECHDDWEEQEDECGYGQWEVAGGMRLGRRRWEDDDDDDDEGNHHCRDCHRRKGLESYYNCGDAYNGRQRERRGVDEHHSSFRDSDQMRRQQRDYHDDKEDHDLRRRRQRWEGRDSRDFEFDDAVDTRRAGSRRYRDDDREYDRRKERRNFDYDDAVDVRRASSKYANDRFDRRTESRDFEIDDEVVRREGRHHSNDDQRYITRHQRRSENTDGEVVSLLESRGWRDKQFDYNDRDLTKRRYYSQGRTQKLARASSLQEDDSKRASSSRNAVDARRARQEENLSSRVRWHDNVDGRTEQASEERDRRYSVDWSNDEKDEYDYDDARFVRVRDARTGTQDVKVITEDDTRLASSSKNTSILKHSGNAGHQAAVHKDESRKNSQKIMDVSEIRGNSTKRDSRAQSYHQEDRGDYVENRSSSLQNSVKIDSDSKRQVDQHNEVNQHLVSLTESRKNSENLTDVTTDSSHNISRACHSLRNYDEVNQTDVDDRSASLGNITHITRDMKRIVNQQVIHETDIDVQNITHVNVSKIRASDISISRSSHNHSEIRSDVNLTSNQSLIDSARDQDEQVYQNKVYASDIAMVRDPNIHPEAGVYDRVHSTSSKNIADNTKESHELVELSKARTSNAAIACPSHSNIQTRIDDRFHSSSAVNTIGSVKEQTDVAKIHGSDARVVSSSQGFGTRNGNQVHKTSAVNLSRERQDMNDQRSTQVSSKERNDELRSKVSESSQDSRDKLVRLEDTEGLVQQNMKLIWQQTSTSGVSDGKDIISLQVESTEEGSSMLNVDTAQQAAIIGRNEEEVRSVTTAGSCIPSSSSARQSVKESMLESASRLEKSSTFHVGQFVDELQKGVAADTTKTKKNEKSIVDGIASSSSGSRIKGPSDEMWDVQSTASQETFKTAHKEEGSSADGATNSASQNGTALTRKVHKSLWGYVADIIRLGWIQHSDSLDSCNKSVKKSSSSNSQSTEDWLSSQEHDDDGIRKKSGSTKAKDQQLIKSLRGEPESRVPSMPKEENLHTGTKGLQISEAGNVLQVGRPEEDLVGSSSKHDVHISGERITQSDVGESPKGNIIGGFPEDTTSTSVDVTIGHLPEPVATTSSRITRKGSGQTSTGKGMLSDTSSLIINAPEADRSDDGDNWKYDSSSAITPYRHPQMQAVMPHENISAAILDSQVIPVGGSMSFEEKNVVKEAPEVIRTERKDAELKRRIFQRNKQVPKETFDEWEDAYHRDAEQRKADELFMGEALLEAQRAADIWEVPVGAVLVQNGEIIARGYNLVEDLRDSTAHAEMVCIREASNKLKTWRLADTTLYVTLEPCAMCAGAILQARIDTVVWGAPNKLLGADGSWVRLFPGDGQTSTLDSANQSQTAGPIHPFHPKIAVRRGVLSAECSEIMQQFFQLRRKKKQKPQSPPRAHHQGHHHPLKFFGKMHSMFGTIFCL